MPVQLASADAVNALVHLLDEVKPIADIITYNSIYWRLRERILAEQVVIL